MIRNFTLAIAAAVATSIAVSAQCTSMPPLMQEKTQNVVIYYHADQGNKGLINMPQTSEIYAHTGVLTNKSASASDWKYAPDWGDNSAKYKLEYVSDNLWKLNIGNIRSYYNITDNDEHVSKLAFVFRTGDKTKEGKGTNDTDIFVEVLPDGMQSILLSSMSGNVIDTKNNTITFSYYSTDAGTLSISVNDTQIATANNATELIADYTFTETGNYKIVGKADINGEILTSELNYIKPKSSPEATYPGGVPQMGAVRNSDGSVTFCIAAPLKNSAMIVGNWDDYALLEENTMFYQDYEGVRYFWQTINGLEEGKDHIYYYLIDGEKRVGDPYARLILDPFNDRYISSEVYPNLPQYPSDKFSDVPLAVFNDNINNYDWEIENFQGVDKSQLFIYELLIRDFTGTEGKANAEGTIRKAIEKIPYLKGMGINAIELMPINEFNGNNSWGYNPNFYFAPDKAYGTPNDYKAFIDECHKNGIAVILDMVFNQSDWLHPWYQMYSVGSNPFYNASAPHAYSVLNDWNQGYPLVKKQWNDVVQYWLSEYKVDGFRFDLVKGLGDNDSYSNSGDSGTAAYNKSRVNNMRAIQNAALEVNPNAYIINENLAGAFEENEMAETGMLNWANINTSGIQYAEGYSDNSSLMRFYAPHDDRTWGSTVSYLESHDEQRLAYAVGQYGVTNVRGRLEPTCARMGSAAAQMMMAPGAHMVWMFSELADSQNNKTASGNNVDPKYVRWNNFDNQYRKGLYTSYAELAGIRSNNPEMFTQDVTFNSNCASNAWANGRTITLTKGDKQIILAVNPNTSGDPIQISANFIKQNDSDYHILSKTYKTEPTFNALYGYLTVPANSYVVIGTSDLAEINKIDSESDNQLRAWSENGQLIIAGANDGVEVYSISGSIIYRNDAPAMGQRLSVNPGIYIVHSGNNTIKISVK